MMKLIACLAVCAVVTALPTADSVVPEAKELSLVQASYNEAKATVASLLQQGKDDNACKDLAKTAAAEVTNSVAAQQATLAAMENGDQCNSEGSTLIDTANNNKNDADQAKNAAQTALNNANTATVNFGDFQFQALPDPAQAFQNLLRSTQAYTTAKAAFNAATGNLQTKTAEAAAAATAVETAKSEAAKLVRACKCTTKKNLASTLKQMNADALTENTKAWTKAYHMQCVVNGQTVNQCTVPALPVVTAVTLGDGVQKACGGSWSKLNFPFGFGSGGPQTQCAGGASMDKGDTEVRGGGSSAWYKGCFASKYAKSMDDLPLKLSGTFVQQGSTSSSDGYIWVGFDTPTTGGVKPHYDCNFDFGLRLYAIEAAKIANAGCSTPADVGPAFVAGQHTTHSWSILMNEDGTVTYTVDGYSKVGDKKVVPNNFPLYVDIDTYSRSTNTGSYITDLAFN